ncbi:MAG: tetratricopeptide repeat protein, partial [Pseudomonadota bacterium]
MASRRTRWKARLAGMGIFVALWFAGGAQAGWFTNRAQEAEAAYERGDYDGALEGFDDDYRRGVVLYRAEHYDEAATAFEAVTRDKVRLDAEYNLGNSRFQLEDYPGAVAAYEKVLQEDPGHADARHNLTLAQARLAVEEPAEEEQPEEEQEEEQEEQEEEKEEQQEEE